MNYYNPYFYTMPSQTTKTSIFSRLFGNFSFNSFLNGTQKALSFANQAIPFVKQVKPIIVNAKTMFRVMNEFKKTEKPRNSINNNINTDYKVNNIQNNYNETGPTFFM